MLKSGVNTLVKNNVNGFKNIKLIHPKLHPLNLKRTFTITSFTNKKLVYSNAQTAGSYAVNNFCLKVFIHLKMFIKKLFLKTKMTCDNRNLIPVVICQTCKEEYIGETGIGDSQLRDRVTIYRQHIREKTEYEKRKVERHLRTCSKGNFTSFTYFRFYNCVQMTQIVSGNMKIAL